MTDFEFHLQNTSTSRRPDKILEDKEKKKIWFCDMRRPHNNSVETERNEKPSKYRKLAYELRERRNGCTTTILQLG